MSDTAACDCNPAGPGPDNAWGDGPPYYDEDCPVHGVIVTAFVKCPECGHGLLAMADEEVTGCAQHGS